MAAEDELAFPEVPEARPGDPEDVSWALSTAEAMWARGDHLEGIKWVRKAAEAASDAEDDERALELAKAASELTSLIARRSRSSHGDAGAGAAAASARPDLAGGVIPEAPNRSAPPLPIGATRPSSARPSGAAPTAETPAAPHHAAPPASQAPPQPAQPAQAQQPAQPAQAQQPQAPQVPPAARSAPRPPSPPAPLATNEARQGLQPGRGVLANRTAPAKPSRRRSRENLDDEARAAGVTQTAPLMALDTSAADRAIPPAPPSSAATLAGRPKRKSRSEPDPTVVTTLADLVKSERRRSAAEWDSSPTQNLSGEELAEHMNEGDRETAFALPASPAPAVKPVSVRPPPSMMVHDPEIETSQAVRVVVWRDGNGVHIAPAGTVVSSITIDAVLVVLEPSADLTAWLSQRAR